MTRLACVVGLTIGLVGCDDEVVGFAEMGAGGSSTQGPTGSTGTSLSTSGSTGGPSESSSGSDTMVEASLPDYVAFGFEAGIAVSFDDGQAWTDIPALPGVVAQEAVVRGEDRIVLVGADQSAVTFDGLGWEVNPFGFTGYARGVAAGAGGFASVGLDHLAWSEDGQTWIDTRAAEDSFDLVAVAYGGGRFVAVGVDQLATSEDGQTWTLTEIVGEKLRSVVFGDGRFVAVGELGRILETQDGVTALRDEASGLSGLGALRICDDAFVIGSSERYWLSPDAEAWTEVMSVGDGAFACSGTSWVVAKAEGLFWAPELAGFDAAHTAKTVFYTVEFTGAQTP